MTTSKPAFTELPDLAVRELGGSVVHATDDFYGDRHNLLRTSAPGRATEMNNRGWAVDSWETGRRRSPGHEYIIVRLAFPGVISGVTVDTSFAGGGWPPEISVEAASLRGYPRTDEVKSATWTSIVDRSPAVTGTENHYEVADGQIYTHVRLSLFPDGSVARLRVHGIVVPDVRLVTGLVDLASIELGAYAVGYSSAGPRANLALSPGRGRNITEGWETPRNRRAEPEYLRIRLGIPGVIRYVEIDTWNYLRNSPGEVRLLGHAAGGTFEVVPRSPIRPDQRQLLRCSSECSVEELTLEMYPDGGVSKIAVYGELGEQQRIGAVLRWFSLLPAEHALSILTEDYGITAEQAESAVAARPLESVEKVAGLEKLLTEPWLAIPA